jgi:hypothetical protein
MEMRREMATSYGLADAAETPTTFAVGHFRHISQLTVSRHAVMPSCRHAVMPE